MDQADPNTHVTDVELIQETLGGNLNAYGILTERHWPLALSLALSRLENSSDAEDVAQCSFIKAYRNLSTLRDPSRFAGWLSRIVTLHCVDVHRQRRRRRRSLGQQSQNESILDALPSYTANPGLTPRQTQFVRHTISQLPEKLKRVVLMRFVGGLNAPEIAQQLGKRPGTIRTQLHRAYERLRHDLSPLLEEVQS